MIRRPPRSTQSRSSAASDVYKRQAEDPVPLHPRPQKRPDARMGYWGLLPDVDDPLMAAGRLVTLAGVVATDSGAAVAPLWALPPQPATAIAALMHAAALVLALGFMIRSARSGDAAMRRPRWFLAAALGACALGYVVVAGSIPSPSVGDVITRAWGPLAAYGFWLVPTRAGSVEGTARMLADGAVAASSLFFASWLAVLQPLAATGRWSPLGQAVQLAYPVLDVFVAAMVLSLLPRARADLRPVSYTHLRAHETRHDLVCRLLLEK